MFTLHFLLNDVDTFQEGKVANIKKTGISHLMKWLSLLSEINLYYLCLLTSRKKEKYA